MIFTGRIHDFSLIEKHAFDGVALICGGPIPSEGERRYLSGTDITTYICDLC